MTDTSTPAETHAALLRALALVGGADFNADSDAGLRQRLQFVKGVLALTNVITVLDPDFASWAEVTAKMAPPWRAAEWPAISR